MEKKQRGLNCFTPVPMERESRKKLKLKFIHLSKVNLTLTGLLGAVENTENTQDVELFHTSPP